MDRGDANRDPSPVSSPSVLSVVSSPAPPDALGAATPGEPAPVTPEWLLRADSVPREAAAGADNACPICMCKLVPGESGPQASYAWPSCGHTLHLRVCCAYASECAQLAMPAGIAFAAHGVDAGS